MATTSTIGAIYCILATGYSDVALLLSLGHAAFRMTQELRSANYLLDYHNLYAALGPKVQPKVIPEPLYKIGWMFNRVSLVSLLAVPQPHELDRGP